MVKRRSTFSPVEGVTSPLVRMTKRRRGALPCNVGPLHQPSMIAEQHNTLSPVEGLCGVVAPFFPVRMASMTKGHSR